MKAGGSRFSVLSSLWAVPGIALITACATTSTQAPLPDQPFFSFDARPEGAVGFNVETVKASAESVGKLVVVELFLYDQKAVKRYREERCFSKNLIRLNPTCPKLLEPKCDEGCEIHAEYDACTVSKIDGRFVTARHCVAPKAKAIYGRFVDKAGKNVSVDFAFREKARHHLPYDIAILDVVGKRLGETIPSLTSAKDFERLDLVYGIGFPAASRDSRPSKAEDYENPWASMKVTYGRIVRDNPRKLSYCVFANKPSAVSLSMLRLREFCPELEFSDFRDDMRVETNVLLAETDIEEAMGGAPLFNAKGQVVGIASSIRGNRVEEDGQDRPGIFSKIENIAEILK